MRDITTLNRSKALEILDRIQFFKAFSPDEKEQLASFYARFYLYNKGECIVEEGEAGTTLFILLTGKVKVYKLPSEDALAYVDPGDMFGEICFLTQEKRISNVSAEEQCIVLEIDEAMMQLFSVTVREKIKDQIIQKLIMRLDEMNQKASLASLKAKASY